MKEQKFLLCTLGLLILVGAPAVYSVVKPPTVSMAVAIKNDNRKPASKEPGSVAEENRHRNAIKAKSVTIEVGCENGDQTQETDGTLLRLKAECWKQGSEDVVITNKTNGFTASVIETKTKGFTTDFIDLQEGENRLEITAKNAQGKAIQKVMTVHRRLPASEASAQD